ncbi:MAG: M48 family metallopeptidase [Chloroflexi bacterium]|nr:M48 family metallopeptidase [Chloroflexota bacterium]
MKYQTSLIGRAILAVLLTFGFYGLAIAIALALFWIVYAEFMIWRRVQWQITLFCIIGGLTILWAILPRWDFFTPPGPRLTKKQHPRLFAQIFEIAQLVKQRIPTEVYLVSDVNAFVTERGGVWGIGARRVMGIGLPLLQAMTISQLRATLAHEFGHYYGGDTALAPWVYKTRGALARTLEGLGDSLLQIPFQAYAELFMRITQSISRQQEFSADALAARVIGRQHLIEGLRVVNGVGPAYQGYWQNELAPVLSSGLRPPLAEGFAQFIAARAVANAMEQIVTDQIKNEQTNVYDTHPALRERIAAVDRMALGREDENTAAISLLNNVAGMERELLAQMFGKQVADLNPVQWQDVGKLVYLPAYEKTFADYALALRGLTPMTVPKFLPLPNELSRRLQEQADHTLTEEEKQAGVWNIVGIALTLALVKQGWEISAPPGLPVAVRQGDQCIEPLIALQHLATGKMSADAWREKCNAWGIANLSLSEGDNQ